MKTLIVTLALVSTLAACGRKDDAKGADDSAVNARDKHVAEPTAEDEKHNAADLKRTREIREAVDGALSTNAENVKIVTVYGHVTLRGPVKTQAEKDQIYSLACQVAGEANVENHIEVETGR